MDVQEKRRVHDFWNGASCGEALYLTSADREGYAAQARERYMLEPYCEEFARFNEARGLRVLEIGVGLGADHQRLAEAGADLYGVDLTERAINHVRQRFAAFGLSSTLEVGDAENLPYSDGFFDLVYSWGVIHHSPDTPRAAQEILRVLKPGGTFRVMIYHKYSMVGAMLWARYGLMRGRPFASLDSIYSLYLESPGTKAYSLPEARKLFDGASEVTTRTVLTHGDLLTSRTGQRHAGTVLTVARKVWPRALIRKFLPNNGLCLLIEGRR